MSARLLAFDTSTEVLAVALRTEAGVFAFDGEGGAAASLHLVPQIEALLARAGLELAALQAIAFGHGPGAFTGLRTSCAVAQGLAFGASLPVLPLDSLLIVAEGARAELGTGAGEGLDLDVVMDARMGEVYAGAYAWTGLRWACRREPALWSLDALHDAWAREPAQTVVGSALDAFGDRLATGPARRLPLPARRAEALLRLAEQAWRDEAGIDPAQALPLYLRDKVALTVAERAAR